jgi:rod shape-determining protein MreD
MISGLWRPLQGLVRHSLPPLMCALFLLLGFACSAMPGLSGIPPLLGLIAIYYWCVHRPDLLPLWLIFLLGLLTDAILRLPFGVSVLSYLAVDRLVQSQRPIFIDQSYLTLWLGCTMVVAMVQLLQWLVMAVITHSFAPIMPLVLQGGITLCLFPLVVWVLILSQRHGVE